MQTQTHTIHPELLRKQLDEIYTGLDHIIYHSEHLPELLPLEDIPKYLEQIINQLLIPIYHAL